MCCFVKDLSHVWCCLPIAFGLAWLYVDVVVVDCGCCGCVCMVGVREVHK